MRPTPFLAHAALRPNSSQFNQIQAEKKTPATAMLLKYAKMSVFNAKPQGQKGAKSLFNPGVFA